MEKVLIRVWVALMLVLVASLFYVIPATAAGVTVHGRPDVDLPLAPTQFTVTLIGTEGPDEMLSVVNITWVQGTWTTRTLILRNTEGYPQNITDGDVVYDSAGNSTLDDGLLLDMTAYYYSAWGWNDYGYSRDYAQTMIGDPITLPGLVFCVGIAGFALWKKDWIRVLLSLCVIIWGAFAMPYDMKIAASLLAAGTVLFIMGIMHVIQARREQREVT